MTDGDRDLLVKLAPKLIELVVIEHSDLLAEMRIRGALSEMQSAIIRVSKQHAAALYYWALYKPFLVES